jgi:PAS domain S-box-containing protein
MKNEELMETPAVPLPRDLAARILDGSPDAIVICDRTGTVQYWNAAAERIFGFRLTDALGRSMDVIIPERLRSRHWAGWEATMRTGVTRYGEGELLAVPALHKDGRQISIEFSIQLVKNAAGRIEWVAALIRDVTARYTREKALRVRLKALEGSNGSDPAVAPLEGPGLDHHLESSRDRAIDGALRRRTKPLAPVTGRVQMVGMKARLSK